MAPKTGLLFQSLQAHSIYKNYIRYKTEIRTRTIKKKKNTYEGFGESLTNL